MLIASGYTFTSSLSKVSAASMHLCVMYCMENMKANNPALTPEAYSTYDAPRNAHISRNYISAGVSVVACTVA